MIFLSDSGREIKIPEKMTYDEINKYSNEVYNAGKTDLIVEIMEIVNSREQSRKDYLNNNPGSAIKDFIEGELWQLELMRKTLQIIENKIKEKKL